METYVYGNAGHITSHRICEGYVFLPLRNRDCYLDGKKKEFARI